MSLFRGLADDVPLKVWLEQQIWPREGQFVSPDFVYDGARLAAAEMLRGGVTCCNDMYFFPDATARAFVELGMRAMLGLPILDFPTAYAADADGYLHAGLAIRDALKHEPCLSFSLSPHAPYTVSDATWKKIVVFARQLDLADPDASRGNGRGVAQSRRAARAFAARPAACAGRDRPRIHRDPRRAPVARRHRAPRDARRSRRALPGVQHEARRRHRAGRRAARARRQRRARHGWGGVEQPARSPRRVAHRSVAGESRDRRRVGAPGAPGARGRNARRRACARPRPRNRLARRGQAGRRHRRRPLRARRYRLATTRSPISSMRWAATRSPMSGSQAGASFPAAR